MNKEIRICQFFVVGLIYYDYRHLRLKEGMRISLVSDPANLYDKNAILVFAFNPKRKRIKLGFVPALQTHEVHGFCGKITRAVIHAYEPPNPTYCHVLINVYGIPHVPERANILC